MLKVLKNLKQSWISVIVIVLLLCVQAAVDLELPNYTSRMVNNGIQSGGIEYVAPNVISKTDMENIISYTEDSNEILEDYTLVGAEELTQKQEKTLKKYTDNNYNNNEIYVIKDLSKEQRQEVSKKMTKPIIIYEMLQSEENAQPIKEQIISNIPEEQRQIFESRTLLEILQLMPKEQLKQVTDGISTKIDEMQDTIQEQAGIEYTKKLYKNVGVNTDDIQMDYITLTGLKMLALAFISIAS